MKKTKKIKICRICGKKLPLDNFWKDKHMKDGYCSYCKTCYNRRWRLKEKGWEGRKYNSVHRKKK